MRGDGDHAPTRARRWSERRSSPSVPAGARKKLIALLLRKPTIWNLLGKFKPGPNGGFFMAQNFFQIFSHRKAEREKAPPGGGKKGGNFLGEKENFWAPGPGGADGQILKVIAWARSELDYC